MKNIVVFFLLILFVLRLEAQNKVTAQVDNFKNNKGICHACIFENAAAFEKMQAIQCVSATVTDKRSTVTFSDLPDGSYAIFVFHDVNSNKKMDKNFLGIPKEGYGASSNKIPFASAPRFSENKFNLNNNSSLHLIIRLRNM